MTHQGQVRVISQMLQLPGVIPNDPQRTTEQGQQLLPGRDVSALIDAPLEQSLAAQIMPRPVRPPLNIIRWQGVIHLQQLIKAATSSSHSVTG